MSEINKAQVIDCYIRQYEFLLSLLQENIKDREHGLEELKSLQPSEYKTAALSAIQNNVELDNFKIQQYKLFLDALDKIKNKINV